MNKICFKRIITLALIFTIIAVVLPTTVMVQASGGHTVQNDGTNYYLPNIPTNRNSYILLKNNISKDVTILIGHEDGYFGSDADTIWNYDSSYSMMNFTSYVSAFNGTTYEGWRSNVVDNSFSLLGYEIIYKSKDIYPVRSGHIFTTLPAGVTWKDKIIITTSSGIYRLYKPANNQGVWVDANNTNCDFVYRDTITSTNQTLTKYTYNTTTHSWASSGTYGRTEGNPGEVFYVGTDVFLTNETVKRVGQRNFYIQSGVVESYDLIYDLSSLLTSNSYIMLRNTSSKFLILLIGLEDGYFGSDTDTIWNYDSSNSIMNFTSYVSPLNGTTYEGWESNTVGTDFSLSGYEIIYKSKDIYPVRSGHMFTTLPEGVTWKDKIIITTSGGIYRLYKPANNQGVWVDANNANCDFVYRDTLTSTNQTLTRYTYNTSTRIWTSNGTYGRTEGNPGEVFYVGANVFLTNGTVKRVTQRKFYAQSSELDTPQFESLEPSEAKAFLKFIANVSDLEFGINIEKKLPEYYAFLTGTIQDPEEELKVKISFVTYIYYCLDIQLAQGNKRIDMGTTYLMNWVGENNQTSTVIYDKIKDELKDNLQSTICKNANIPGISTSFGIITGVLDYGELVIHSIGSIMTIRTIDEIRYLIAYMQLLKAEYEKDISAITIAELNCDIILVNMGMGGDKEEMERYAKYIFDIERSLPN